MEPGQFRPLRTLSILLAAAAGTVLLFVGVNLAVDPYGVRAPQAFLRLHLKSRRSIEKNEYLHKAYAIAAERPETVYFGNSRVCVGLPADDALWKSKTFNCGLTAAQPEEIAAYLRHAFSIGGVKRVVIGLDALAFLGPHAVPSTFDASLLRTEPSSRVRPAFASPGIFSMGAFTDSIKTLLRQRGAEAISYPQGVRDPDGIRGDMHGDSAAASESVLALLGHQLEDAAAVDPQKDGERVDRAREMATLCREHGVEVIVFFPPIHHRVLELIETRGMTARLASIQEQVRAVFETAGLPSLTVVDFSHGQPHALDDQYEKPGSKVWKWWWEVSHFRQEFGREIVEQLAQASKVQASHTATQGTAAPALTAETAK